MAQKSEAPYDKRRPARFPLAGALAFLQMLGDGPGDTLNVTSCHCLPVNTGHLAQLRWIDSALGDAMPTLGSLWTALGPHTGARFHAIRCDFEIDARESRKVAEWGLMQPNSQSKWGVVGRENPEGAERNSPPRPTGPLFDIAGIGPAARLQVTRGTTLGSGDRLASCHTLTPRV